VTIGYPRKLKETKVMKPFLPVMRYLVAADFRRTFGHNRRSWVVQISFWKKGSALSST
jgi:hypothetical protein